MKKYYNVVYCTVCGEELSCETVVVDALGHDMGEWYQTVAPACTTEGENRCDCSRCDYFETVSEPANGHTEGETVVENRVEPTCTEVGGYDNVIYCSVCEAELNREHVEIPATGHMHEVTITAPTCSEQGYTTHTCYCGDVFADSYVDALGHTDVIDAAVAPTCTETGMTEGKHCDVCHEILTAQEVVPALGHTYESVVTDPTCKKNGYTTHTCHCGDTYVDSEAAALGHTPSDWIVDTEPQIGVAGSKHKECTTCGEVVETEVIEALPDVPTTEEPTTEEPATEEPTTEAPMTENNSSGNCNGIIGVPAVLIVLLSCFAIAWHPRKDS